MLRSLASLALLGSVAASASAQTSFTYQGRLDRDGTPQPGVFDLQFSLFNDPAAGAQIGSTICSEDVIVADDGTFTTTLDFGQLSYLNPMYLEIGVRSGADVACSDPREYDVLPRQPLTASPMAFNALRLNGLSSSFFTNAANLSSGLLADARLSSLIPRLNQPNTFVSPATFNAGITVHNQATLHNTANFLSLVNFQSVVTFGGTASFNSEAMFGGQVTMGSAPVYSSPVTRTIFLGSATAQPSGNFSFARGVNFVNATVVNEVANFEFPITIPSAARITGLTVYATDNSATSDYNLTFMRCLVTSPTQVVLATSNPVVQSPAVTALPIAFSPVTIAPLNAYSLRIIYTVPSSSSTMRIHGVEVTYEIDSPE